MNLKQFLFDISKPLHADAYLVNQRYAVELDDAYEHIQQLIEEHDEYSIIQSRNLTRLQNQVDKLKQPDVSPIDTYLREQNLKQVKNIAYKNKREDVGYSVYLNEMITPKAYEVDAFRYKFRTYTSDWSKMNAIANWIAKNTTWVNEPDLYKSGDYYLYPSETLTGKRDVTDCEELAFLLASIYPDRVAAAYGFLTKGKQRFGHAFPVFLYNNKLYIIEMTGTKAEIIAYPDARYEAYYFITTNHTYELNGSVRFGEIANYEV